MTAPVLPKPRKPQGIREAVPGLRRLVPHVRAHLRRQRTLIAGGGVAMALEVVMRLLEPWPMKFVIDGVIGHLGADLPQALFVLGPFMEPAAQESFLTRAAALPEVTAMVFDAEMERIVEKSSGVVAMGGYNTVSEILSTTTPALIVPRTQPRVEQLIRATGLAAIGAVDTLPIEDLTPEDIGSWFAGAVTTTTDRSAMALDGLGEVVALAAPPLQQVITGPLARG